MCAAYCCRDNASAPLRDEVRSVLDAVALCPAYCRFTRRQRFVPHPKQAAHSSPLPLSRSWCLRVEQRVIAVCGARIV